MRALRSARSQRRRGSASRGSSRLEALVVALRERPARVEALEATRERGRALRRPRSRDGSRRARRRASRAAARSPSRAAGAEDARRRRRRRRTRAPVGAERSVRARSSESACAGTRRAASRRLRCSATTRAARSRLRRDLGVAEQLLAPTRRRPREDLDDQHVRHHRDHVLEPLATAAGNSRSRSPRRAARIIAQQHVAGNLRAWRARGRARPPTSACARPRRDSRPRRARALRTARCARWASAVPRRIGDLAR